MYSLNRLRSEPVPADYSDETARDGPPHDGVINIRHLDCRIIEPKKINTLIVAYHLQPPLNAAKPSNIPPIPPRRPLNAQAAAPPPNTPKPTPAPKSSVNCDQINDDGPDSLGSVDSNDEQLFQQCIRMGMQRATNTTNTPTTAVPKPPAPIQQLPHSPKRSQLPVLRSAAPPVDRDRQNLYETGVENNIRTMPQQTMQKAATMNPKSNSKNVEATSAAVPATKLSSGVPSTAPGVETAMYNINIEYGTDHHQPHVAKSLAMSMTHHAAQQPIERANQYNGDETKHSAMTKIGFNNISSSSSNGVDRVDANESMHSAYGMNSSCDSHILLDHSNEYPASALSTLDDNDDSINDCSIEMEVSNEFLTESVEGVNASMVEKLKDPDLMMRSMERLTQNYMSQAEYLRTSSSQHDDTVSEEQRTSVMAATQRTWNEDSEANDVSYPSLSMTAPVITSLHDTDTSCSNTSNCIRYVAPVDEPTPTNEYRSFTISHTSADDADADGQPMSVDTVTLCSVDPPLHSEANGMCDGASSDGSVINFQVGGHVQQPMLETLPNYLSTTPYSIDTYSSMTQSTMIAMEANKLRADLFNMSPLTDSMTSLDLDHIRPPSVMDNVSMSGHLDAPNSPQLRMRKKSLQPGIMARRALNHNNPNGSMESVNSSLNLDNIKPPSLMDELLDSMMSVDSITSEVVENTYTPMHNNGEVAVNGDEVSHYETANSEYDDTTTLRSCMDLPVDTTPIPSDFSSAESTPRKGALQSSSAPLTPVQRRQANKDRYRTYTIPVEQRDSNDGESSLDAEGNARNGEDEIVSDDMVQIEIDESPVRRLTPRQRRQEDRSRFQTQVLDSEMIAILSSSSVESSPQTPRRNRNDARFLTRTISHDEKAQRRNQFCEAVVNDNERDRVLRGRSHDFLLNDDSDSISLVSTDDNDEMSSIRALTQQFQHLRDLNSPTTTNGYGNRSAAAMALNAMRPSRAVAESQPSSIDFDHPEDVAGESYSNENDELDEQTYTIPQAKPRIIKPNSERDHSLDSGNSEGSVNSPEGKAIRGRKKAAYVSPYKARLNGSPKAKVTPKPNASAVRTPPKTATKTMDILSKTNLANQLSSVKKSLSKTGITSKLVRKNVVAGIDSVTQPDRLMTGDAATKKKCGVTKATATVSSTEETTPTAPAPQMPDRQGTFIKDKPSNIDVPVVYSEPTSPQKTPTATQSKIPASKSSTIVTPKSFISKLRSPLQRSATTTQPIASLTGQTKRNSVAGGVYKSPSTPYVSQRSNSNTSMKSTASSSSSATKQSFVSQPPSRSNSIISSRIAGLWKRSNSDAKTSHTTPASPVRQLPGHVAYTRPPSGSKFTAATPTINGKMTATVAKTTTSNVGSKPASTPTKTTGVTPRTTGSILGGVLLRTKNEKANTTNEDKTKRISRLSSFVKVHEQ